MIRRTFALLLVAAAVGCGRTSGLTEIPPEDLPFDVARLESPTMTPETTRQYAVYFVRDDRLAREERELDTAEAAAGVLRVLLDGPGVDGQGEGLSTEIPTGVRLLDVAVANRVARVDLSGEFQAPAPPERIAIRVAQVVWTLTALPAVRSVSFSIDGEPIAVTTDDGAAVERRVSRDDYARLAPAR